MERTWRGEGGAAGSLLSGALAPAELLFRAGIRLRAAAYDAHLMPAARMQVPVVSIGNIAVGGAGKTPVTAWLARRLAALGHHPAVLHGGYAQDEPELHRTWNPDIPVYVGRDRVVTARTAVSAGASVLLLDDAFQHRRLDRTLDLVLLAAESWTSRPHLLPRGPWREPPSALDRATAIVVIHRTEARAAVDSALAGIRAVAPGRPTIVLALRADVWRRGTDAFAAEPERTSRDTSSGDTAPAGEVVAVAAIAQPALFVENTRNAGANVTEVITFADHHEYDDGDVADIERRAAGRGIVTTAKDWIKLRTLLEPGRVPVLVQRVEVEQGGEVLEALLASLPLPQ